jgi:hypothetical protein
MQQVKVDRALQFQGSAANKDNVEGNPSFSKMVIYDDFTCVTVDTTNDYTSTLDGTADAVAITAAANGKLRLTTGTTDNQVSFLASALVFDISKNPVIETKLTITDVSGTVLYFGFSDANTEATPDDTIDYADATLAATATDAVGFVCDADKVTSTIYAASVATGGSVAAATTGVMWADGETKTLRIALNSDGDATFFIDGVVKNVVQAAVTDVPLCFIYNYGTRANDSSNTIDVDYVKAWQDR